MAGTERTSKLTGFEALGLLTGTHRGGDWSGPLPELTGLSVDSRQTEPGHLFAALPGSQAHGAAFIPAALAAGAEHDDEAAHDVGPERGERGGQGVGRVGVVDEDEGAVGAAGGALHAAADGAERREGADDRGRVGARADGEAGGDQRVGGLEAADQI